MKYRCLILVFVVAGTCSTLVAQQRRVRATYSPKESAFEVSVEPWQDRDALVVKLSHDGVALPPLKVPAVVPGALLGTVVDVKSDGTRLALVINWGGISLKYQCYDLQAGQWVLRSEKLFYELTSERLRTLCLIRLESLDTVRVTLLKKGEEFHTLIMPGGTTPRRIQGQVEVGDPNVLFKFNPDGSILRDGQPYEGGGND